ncbi:MAG: TrmH family RNA methyltransferase [Geminicoccaceae bacterium]
MTRMANGGSGSNALIGRFRTARKSPTLVVLEGLHALKHGRRFGASLLELAVRDKDSALGLAEDLALDLVHILREHGQTVGTAIFEQLAPQAHETGVIAIAQRPKTTVDVPRNRRRPLVLLEDPQHLGNLGAVVRTAAAADAAGVVTIGGPDPWHPVAVRTAAGLHFALPVCRLTEPVDHDQLSPLIAVDTRGEPFSDLDLPRNAVLAFGSERRGLSPGLLARAERCVSIPMRDGISSLNLATSVAALLYAGRFRAL